MRTGIEPSLVICLPKFFKNIDNSMYGMHKQGGGRYSKISQCKSTCIKIIHAEQVHILGGADPS